jgi:hypothetical protein
MEERRKRDRGDKDVAVKLAFSLADIVRSCGNFFPLTFELLLLIEECKW